MSKEKTIYCPSCGRKVGVWDGKTTVNRIFGCRKCWKEVVFHVGSGKTELKPWPERKTSSGMTFV